MYQEKNLYENQSMLHHRSLIVGDAYHKIYQLGRKQFWKW